MEIWLEHENPFSHYFETHVLSCHCHWWNVKTCVVLCRASSNPLQPLHLRTPRCRSVLRMRGPPSVTAKWPFHKDKCHWEKRELEIDSKSCLWQRLSTPGYKEAVWMCTVTCGWTLLVDLRQQRHNELKSEESQTKQVRISVEPYKM